MFGELGFLLLAVGLGLVIFGTVRAARACHAKIGFLAIGARLNYSLA